jgi:hypothetical protein
MEQHRGRNGNTTKHHEAKMHNIRSQFMRERKKIQNSMKSGAGADEVYVRAWFAYQHLLFLLNNVDPGESSDILSQHSYVQVK